MSDNTSDHSDDETPSLDLGDDFAPEDLKPPPPIQEYHEMEGEEFSPEVIVKAMGIKDVTPHTIIRAIYNKTAGKDAIGRKDYRQLTLKEFVHHASVVSSLGSSRCLDSTMGDVQYDRLDELESYDVDVLKASLTKPMSAYTSMLTDGMLAQFVATLRGAVVKQTKLGSEITIPQYSGGVTVSNDGSTRGRVVSGGDEFIAWYNSVAKTKMAYQTISRDAVAHAYLISAACKVQFTDKSVAFADREKPPKSSIREFVKGVSSKLQPYLKPIKNFLSSSYANMANRPPIPRSGETLAYIEYLLHKKYQDVSPGSAKNIQALTDKINEVYEEEKARYISELKEVFSLGLAVDPKSLMGIRSGKVRIAPIDLSLATHGSVGNFVKESRSAVRAHNDLPRKSDSRGGAHAAGVASSVAAKITNAITMLSSIMDTRKYSADAYGTHTDNWWLRPVEDSVKDVTYYDKGANYAPKNSGAKFFVGDVETIAPGSGYGKLIFDDTLNVPDRFGSGQPHNASEVRKIQSIVSAGYEGGIIKLYYGAVDDSTNSIAKLPHAIDTVASKYHAVILTQGGGPHSPEYFIVFGGKKGANSKYEKWLPPRLVVRGNTRYYEPRDPVEGIDVNKARNDYLNTWISIKVYDIIRANMFLNLQVSGGIKCHTDIETWLDSPTNYGAIKMGGRVTISPDVPESALPPGGDVGNIEFDFGDAGVDVPDAVAPPVPQAGPRKGGVPPK